MYFFAAVFLYKFFFAVKIAQNEQLYFAEQLYTAIFDGDGDHDTIIRIVVTRSEVSQIFSPYFPDFRSKQTSEFL